MKKRKKKPSTNHNQKILDAQRKNDFLHRLKNLCKTLGVSHVYNMITADDLNKCYMFRHQTLRIFPAPGNNIPSNVLDLSKYVFSALLKNYYVKVTSENAMINYYDYLTVYLTLLEYKNNLSQLKNPNKDKIISALQPIEEYYKFNNEQNSMVLIASLMYISDMESDIQKKVYWFNTESQDSHKGHSGTFNFLYVYSHEPESRNFIIDNVSRPAIRVGWAVSTRDKSYTYVSVPAEKINTTFKSSKLTFDVYIQSHAIQRLTERLDGLYPGKIFFSLYFSTALEIKPLWYKNSVLLIDMNVQSKKVGYLVCDIVDWSIVIRSFLFLTHTGTPEGDKLMEITGLHKDDKSYLQIDKLSTFLASDIHENEQVKDLFIQAGCGSLFELDRNLMVNQVNNQSKSKAEIILEYLGLNKVEENYNEDDSDNDVEEIECDTENTEHNNGGGTIEL